jgi:hypothetical protein
MKSFFNSINISDKDLEKAEQKASTQDELVYQFFKNNPNKLFTPLSVHKQLFGSKVPETSSRRSITRLTGKGLLVKRKDIQEPEKYGSLNYVWQLHQVDSHGNLILV